MRSTAFLASLAALGCCAALTTVPLAAQQRYRAVPPESLDACRGPCDPKRVGVAIVEGQLVNLVVNRFDVWAHPPDGGHFAVSPESWASNLKLGWTWDDNKFSTNLLEHPLHGATYFERPTDGKKSTRVTMRNRASTAITRAGVEMTANVAAGTHGHGHCAQQYRHQSGK